MACLERVSDRTAADTTPGVSAVPAKLVPGLGLLEWERRCAVSRLQGCRVTVVVSVTESPALGSLAELVSAAAFLA